MKLIRSQSDELNFPPSLKVCRALDSFDLSILQRYQKTPPLLCRLAKEFDVPRKSLFLEGGIMGIIHRVLDYRLAKGSSILLPDLSFPPYVSVAKHRGADIHYFKLKRTSDSFAYDIQDLLLKLQDKPDVLVLVDPESPLGFSLPTEVLDSILTAAGPKTLVLLDQAHEGFREDHAKEPGILIRKYPNLLVARDFSKFYGLAGLRIGFAICGENVKKMINFQERYLGFNNHSQHIAIAALDSQNYYVSVARTIRKEKYWLSRKLANLGYHPFKTDHMSVLVETTSAERDAINSLCRKKGIRIRDLATYHGRLENFYRIAVSARKDNERILEVFSLAKKN